MSLNVLLIPMGSSGDVDPMVGLGRALQRRGHSAAVLVNPHFEKDVTRAGLAFAPLGTAEDYHRQLENPELWDPRRAFYFVVREAIVPHLRPIYEWIAERYEPGRTVVAAGTLAFGARVAHDKFGVPLASVHLQPVAFRSTYASPAGISLLPRWLPRFVKRWEYRALDWLLIDRALAPGVNGFRAELGLPPVRGFFDGWCHAPQLSLGFFPDWYAAPQPDWPPQARTVGFPLYDHQDVEPLSADLQAFLDAGPPPLVFTFGSAMRHAHTFFAESVTACRLLGRRGLLLTRYREQVPADLPADVRHVDFAPFSLLFPHATAIVHHGGIGTTAQALAAGVPQLVVPFAHDQPDNAERIRRLGVGAELRPGKYRAPAVAAALGRLLDDPQVAGRCKSVAQKLPGVPPLEKACEEIERLV